MGQNVTRKISLGQNVVGQEVSWAEGSGAGSRESIFEYVEKCKCCSKSLTLIKQSEWRTFLRIKVVLKKL